MAGFDWDAFYSLFHSKMKSVCNVGRYTIPKPTTYPYCDVALSDNPGGNYDLENNEGNVSPMITVTVYCNHYDDATCCNVSMKAKELMLSYGFQCKAGPFKIDNTDPAVARWIARYQRSFGDEDRIMKLH